MSESGFKYVYQGIVGERDTRHEAIGGLAKHGDWENDQVVAISENCLVHWADNGPTHLGDEHYGYRKYLATKHGAVRIEVEELVRHVNGNEQETVESEWFADCPVCRREVRVEAGDGDARSDLVSEILDHCGTEWFPPSDWVEDCEICGADHRERHGCPSPIHRAHDLEHPIESVDCAECEFEGEPDDLDGPQGVCPDCGTTAVRLHQAVPDGGDEQSPAFLRQGGIQQRMKCGGSVAHNIEKAFVTVDQLVEAVESDDSITEVDGIGPKTAEVIEDWWENREAREASASSTTVTRQSTRSLSISFHQSWGDALGIEVSDR